MFKFNTDVARRDEIFGWPHDVTYMFGTHYFDHLDLDELRTLVEERFADPDERQNDAPSIGELILFGESLMQTGNIVTFHGYAVEIRRSDYRVSIEGFHAYNLDDEAKVSALLFARFADDLTVGDNGEVYCWWD